MHIYNDAGGIFVSHLSCSRRSGSPFTGWAVRNFIVI